MAIFIMTDGFLSIDANDLSDHMKSLTLNYNAEILDASAMGIANTRTRVKGLLDWTVNVEYNQDFADTATVDDNIVDKILFPLVEATVTAALVIRPFSTARTAINPEFTGNAYLETYTPLAGGVADIATVTSTFGGSGPLDRNNTP